MPWAVVAGVAGPISVGVGLRGIGQLRAVVAFVPDAVPVVVHICRGIQIRAVVAGIREGVRIDVADERLVKRPGGADEIMAEMRGVRADAERLQRFEREAKSLAGLNHPNVAQTPSEK